ncbi:MAG: hypothetical protein MI976_11285 [Pseudomonadales bacterium]|nr:hypothetical protein [Pseudomonadales bacterium]
MLRDDKDLTEAQLKKAFKSGEVIGLAANNARIRYVFAGGVATGTVITSRGNYKNYRSDEGAWRVIDAISTGVMADNSSQVSL